jgi:CRISPR-associated protein Csy2
MEEGRRPVVECPYVDHLLVVPRLRVQNANAVSSPQTHGFLSMTALLGLMWALERRTAAAGLDLRFNAVGVVCHAHQEQTTEGGFVNAFCLTRNPIGKDGSTAAIVEEGRIHLDISLVFGLESQALCSQLPGDNALHENIAAQVREMLMSMRIAGGSVLPSQAPPLRQKPYAVPLTGDEEDRQTRFNRAKLRLLPGFALVSRDDLLDQRHAALCVQDPAASRLDAWLSLARINWRYDEASEKWQHDREKLGWVVPIPVGYGALSEVQAAGSVVNARDASTPFRFVESLYSVGQWISPHRLHSPRQLLWYADSQPDEGRYRCRNDYRNTVAHDFE